MLKELMIATGSVAMKMTAILVAMTIATAAAVWTAMGWLFAATHIGIPSTWGEYGVWGLALAPWLLILALMASDM